MGYPRSALGIAAVLSLAAAGALTAQSPERLVVSSDPALAALAGELLPDLARRSGMELTAPIRVERRSRQELVRYLEHQLDQELPSDEARALVDVYSLLGLVAPDLDLRAVLLGLYTEQVSGFYDPDSTALFVLDDQAEEDLRGLLVHELVHAVQDQGADLDALTDSDRGSDRASAAQAAIEGHATLVMMEYMAEEQMGQPVDLGLVPGFGAMLRQNLQGIRSQFPALAGAPPIFRETLIFPYIEGAVYLQERWAEGERVVPFGDALPMSTEQILEGPSAAEPLELTVEVTGGDLVRDDVLGRLEIGILLGEHVGPEAAQIAEGWDGDRFVLVEGSAGRALVWHGVWESGAIRDRFVITLSSALDRFGGPAELEAVDIVGIPGARLVVGDLGGASVRVVAAERR